MTIEEKRRKDRERKAAERELWTAEMAAEKANYLREWRKKNPGYEDVRRNSPERKAWRVQYAEKRKPITNEKQNARRAALPEEKIEALNAYGRNWRKMNPDKTKRPGRTKMDCQNPVVRLIKNLRRRVHHVISSDRKSGHTLELLGCSTDQFLGHLEIRFQEGMTWENYGPVWHMDHVRPCASFDLRDPKQQRECFGWRNYQPLFAKDNLSKGAKIVRRKRA
jgi:hypothetical protein